MKIILTGSLGNVSRQLTSVLVTTGHTVTVITSKPEKKRDIELLGAVAAVGSVRDARFLTTVFSGADAVYCMVPPNFNEPDQVAYYRSVGENYATAIQQAGIKKVVHLSSYGAHLSSGTGFIVGSYTVENILNQIVDVRVTHIRPTYFYQNLLAFIKMIKNEGFIGYVYGGDDKLAVSSPVDIAIAIAQELQTDNGNQSTRYVTSDDRTCNEIAAILGKAIGKPDLKWNVVSPEGVLKSLLARGVPESTARVLIELGQATHTGVLREDYELNRPEFGKVSVEDFSQEFAAIYHNV